MKHKGLRPRVLVLLVLFPAVHAQYNFNQPIEQNCGKDDFVCNNGACIVKERRCDGIVDCSAREDEQNCDCNNNQFKCRSDGSCIEMRKRCDGTAHCTDSSDEVDCACRPDQWQCDNGSCIKRSKRCDGRVDCPSDRSDERKCLATGGFKCQNGKIIPQHLRCNRHYDCPIGDYSDELNCPCGDNDFTCDNGHCIPASKRCDTWTNCQDGSDERHCTYEKECMAYEHKCDSGQCVPAESKCNGTVECTDGSDEVSCPCKRDQFKCQDGSCISIALICNGFSDCPGGEDELSCGRPQPPEDAWDCGDGSYISITKVCNHLNDCFDGSDEKQCTTANPSEGISSCPEGSYTCPASSVIPCATKCDGRVECSEGDDERDCEQECSHECDGRCLDDSQICNGVPDCFDSSDELQCDLCDGPDDFRCGDGECISISQRCNGLQECNDESDEQGCSTIEPSPPRETCSENQFKCRSDGICINSDFRCDGHQDCDDNSDELGCACSGDQWRCRSGQCIPAQTRCDGVADCTDYSDEDSCPTSPPRPATPPPTTTPYPYYPSTSAPYFPNVPIYPTTRRPMLTTTGFPIDRCAWNEWRCENGPCISSSLRCNGHVDCPFDMSDEFDCPAGSPIALDLKTYPDAETVRNAKYLSDQGTLINKDACGDVVLRCRDEGPMRAPVRWVRERGRRIKPGATDVNGRLEINNVNPSDSGVYICQAPGYLGQPGAEQRVILTVDTTPTYKVPPPAVLACQPNEATCANGQCISKKQVCDGRRDCSDGSDEESCNNDRGMCEPNQYQCANRRCVLKTWLCDSEDDCLDGSDEQNCGPHDPRQPCNPVEFACSSNDQCVPKSFHCDGQSDCGDGSDEIGCAPVHITRPPSPANLRLNVGDTLTLTCEGVGVPVPLISWRLNWGHVPEQCIARSENGIGTLVCPNMQAENSGAYSCEGINNRGTVFAYPDAIVYVNHTDVCPVGYFNSEARSESECIRCFCFGEATQCHSADLFTYNMPTPLGEGGTRLINVRLPNGQIEIDKQVSNQYFYQPLWNGATITKLARYDPYQQADDNAHPYLSLPESYNGNQLTSYGGRIKYKLAPHKASRYGDDNLPEIIIKGKYVTLVYIFRGDKSRTADIEARFTPEDWMKVTRAGQSPASREDIMMTLDNIEMILLRGDYNNAGVNVSDFSMESAQHINVGLGAANLVEECSCPPGYEGLSCQKCAAGYTRDTSGPWLGNCVRERPCAPGEYGDPSRGVGCRPCPCPLTNPQNQFARTCSLAPDGGVICDCAPGYTGRNCERCEEGYVGNPLIIGDSCRVPTPSSCNPLGTFHSPMPDECQCKDHVTGRYCDQCKNDSFYLSADFRQGCAQCFCSGVSQKCQSSKWRRRTTNVRFNSPQIAEQVKIFATLPTSEVSGVKFNAPVPSPVRPRILRGELGLVEFDKSQPTVYYWSLPLSFLGDKVTSYGGFLRYVVRHVPTPGSPSTRNTAADVLLMSEYSPTFHYFGDIMPGSDGIVNGSVQFLETGWQRPDGKEIAREHFLLALADVSAILVKATYTEQTELAAIESASIEAADRNGDGPQALHVEDCDCPPNYEGTSCEKCAPGFKRNGRGLYLEQCGPCECNDHSNSCDPETGVCYDCRDNTAGDQCESCKPGYIKDSSGYCYPGESQPPPSPDSECRRCDPRGTSGPCDDRGCQCKQNVEGVRCDTCRPGTFGLSREDPLGCISCYCSGVTSECREATGYARIMIPAPIFGDNYGGYTLTDLNGEQVINDQFVPAPNESELMYMFSSYPRTDTLYWSLPAFPGNRLLSYGGTLQLTQKFESGGYAETSSPGVDVIFEGDGISIYWSNPTPIRAGEALSYQVPIREHGWFLLNSATPASRADFMAVLKNLRRVLVRATLGESTVSTAIADVSMDTATDMDAPGFPAATGVEICMCPEGYSGTSCEDCRSGWYKDTYGRCVQCNCNGHDCQLGAYNEVVCNCKPPYSGLDCTTVGRPDTTTYNPIRPPPSKPTVVVKITSPTIKIQEVGSSVNFTCQAQSRMTNSRLPVRWIKEGGDLPQGRSQVDSRSGLLLITNLQMSDSGKYICETSDGVSTAQAFATLRVPGNEMTMPTATIDPPTREYYEGDQVTLRCIVTGNPTPRVTWQRATSRPLPLSATSYDGTLVIENVMQEDAGEYRCIATNAVGRTDRSAFISVRPRPSRPRERLTVTPQSPQVTEGQSTRVVCTGTSNMPPGSIEWIRQDGVEFLPNVRSDNGVLHIERALPDNQGVYLCRAALSSTEPIAVTLVVIPVGTPSPSDVSNITVNVDRLRLATGASGSVECIPTGYPLPFIKWKKHDGNFGPSVSQRENSLIIASAEEDDQGYYQCEGLVDGVPIENIFVYVEVEKREEPKVMIYPQGDQAVQLGHQFEFHCRVLGGVPAPDVTWDRSGGRPLSSTTQILPQNILRFESIEVNDEGEYTCTATNSAGRASASATLKVRSPPEITITPTNYLPVILGDSVKVECRARGYPQPLVSIRRSDNYQEVVPPSPGIAVLRIPSVGEGDDGEYVCSASNAAGNLEESLVLRVDRGDGGDGGLIPDGGSGDGEFNPPPGANDIEPRSMIAYEGDRSARIECDASGDYDTQWHRIDRALQRNAVATGPILTIYNVSKSDAGQYECAVIDRSTHEVQHAAYTSLKVVSPPRITLRPPTQTVPPGSSPTVECIVDGDDIIDVSWRPLDKAPSRRVEMNGQTLIFHQIEVEDAGRYECLARNRYANVTAEAKVTVSEDTDGAPLESHENEQYAHVGAGVQLSCNVTQAYARISWTKNDKPVPSHRQRNDGSLYIPNAKSSDSGYYMCIIEDQYGRKTHNYINLHIGPSEGDTKLVSIDQPNRQFRVGENVEVICRARSRDTRVEWERYANQQRQYVESYTYGGGSKLVINNVQETDAGLYRCSGRDPQGYASYDDFNLEVIPVSISPSRPINEQDTVYTVHQGNLVDLPCTHDLDEPVQYEWRREYTLLPPDIRTNEHNLHLVQVTEADAGTYVCRVSNRRAAVEARAILRVEGVVPRFDGESYAALPTLKDAFRQFNIEVSFKPSDANGLILYNGHTNGPTGDYIALQILDGVPQFVMDSGSGPVTVSGDRPLILNTWHTIRISKKKTQLSMDVDNYGPSVAELSEEWEILDLSMPLYVGGVPDYNQLPPQLAGASGFFGCVGMLVLGREEKNIMVDSIERHNVRECDSCTPNLCHNNGVCQEARNKRGYVCLCSSGFAGHDCDRTGEACHPGLCGPGKCTDTSDGYKCACPVNYTGRKCDVKQAIEYPAFTGSAYLAIEAPKSSRTFRMTMKIKATAPVTDGIIMYCAESQHGYGGFISLAVRNGRLEFRYDLGDGTPVVLTANRTLPANTWTDVTVTRMGPAVTMRIDVTDLYQDNLLSPKKDMTLDTPMFVGGVDSIVLNNNTGVTGGFNGCIKDVQVYGNRVDIVNSSIQSANVQECSNYDDKDDRGDIPESEGVCSQCRNGGRCLSADATACTCPQGYTGLYCETRIPLPSRRPSPINPCQRSPCRNGGTCFPDKLAGIGRLNYTCDCPLGFAGANCQMNLQLLQSVGFNGNGYLELPSSLVRYDNRDGDPAVIALVFHTTSDGVLVYQREAISSPTYGDFILLRIDNGRVVLDWDLGSGPGRLAVEEVFVNNGELHNVVAMINDDNTVSLTVDSLNTKTGLTTGLSNLMNADSSIYIGGIPEQYNLQRFPGLTGCIDQVELMDMGRSLNLGSAAIGGKNTHRCRDSRSN